MQDQTPFFTKTQMIWLVQSDKLFFNVIFPWRPFSSKFLSRNYVSVAIFRKNTPRSSVFNFGKILLQRFVNKIQNQKKNHKYSKKTRYPTFLPNFQFCRSIPKYYWYFFSLVCSLPFHAFWIRIGGSPARFRSVWGGNQSSSALTGDMPPFPG